MKTKLTKHQRYTLEKMAAGDVVYIAPEGVFRWYPSQVAARRFTLLVQKELVTLGGGARFVLTPSGRELLKKGKGE